MTRFWLGRSVAGRLLSLETTRNAADYVSHRRKELSLLAEYVHTGNPAGFYKKRDRIDMGIVVKEGRFWRVFSQIERKNTKTTNLKTLCPP
jgi:hypothetical protein